MERESISPDYHHPEQQAAWLSAIVESSSDAIIGKTLEGTITSWNSGAERLYGHSAPEALGQPIGLIVPPERAGEVDLILARVRQGERIEHFETVRMRKDGSLVDVSLTISPIQDAAGQLIGASTTGRDITDRRRVEHALREIRTELESRVDERTAALQRREHQLERLVDAALRLNAERSLDTLLQNITDSARDVLDCRYSALGVLAPGGEVLSNFVHSGLSPEEVSRIGALPTGKGVLGVLLSDSQPLRLVSVAAHPRSAGFPAHHPPMGSFLGVPVTGREGPFGNLYCTEKNGGTEFTPQDERVASMLAALAAIAVENARLMEAVQQASVSRDRFYAMMNHELRNALTGAYGWIQILVRPGQADKSRAVTQALSSAEDAVQLMNDLLDLSRLDAGRMDLKLEPTAPDDIIAEAVRTVLPMAQQRAVRLEVPAIEQTPRCVTDSRRVRQILVNLMRNAIQHSPTGQAVHVDLKADDRTVAFAVKDSGPGIEMERQKGLFEAYTRGSYDSGGTGLGLTLSRQLARLLGGDLMVESQVGKGATFTVQIARFLTRPN